MTNSSTSTAKKMYQSDRFGIYCALFVIFKVILLLFKDIIFFYNKSSKGEFFNLSLKTEVVFYVQKNQKHVSEIYIFAMK